MEMHLLAVTTHFTRQMTNAVFEPVLFEVSFVGVVPTYFCCIYEATSLDSERKNYTSLRVSVLSGRHEYPRSLVTSTRALWWDDTVVKAKGPRSAKRKRHRWS